MRLYAAVIAILVGIIAKADAAPYVFVNRGLDVVRVDLDGSNLTTITDNNTPLELLGVDEVRQQVYFGGSPTEVWRANFDGSNPELFLDGWRASTFEVDAASARGFFAVSVQHVVYVTDLENPAPTTPMLGLNFFKDTAYDARSGLLYMSNGASLSTGDNIWSVSIADGTMTEVISGSDKVDILGVAVDPINNKLIFSMDKSPLYLSNAIFQSNLDGSDLRMLIDTTQFGNSEPFDVDVVPELQSIVWSDPTLGGLYIANLDGTNPRLLFEISGAFQFQVVVPEPASSTLSVVAGCVLLGVTLARSARRGRRGFAGN